jgi:ABC-type transporter Mla subunit MlaD
VRYAGGPPIGRVTKVEPDPQNPAQMRIEFRVESKVPVKVDSTVKISSLSVLGDNFLGIVPGTPTAPQACDGAILKTDDYKSFDDIETRIGDLTPKAEKLLKNLNSQAEKLQGTIRRVNDRLNAQNLQKFSKAIAHDNEMLADNGPALHSRLNHLDDASVKIDRRLDNLKKTLKKTNLAITHLDQMVAKDQPKIHASLLKLHEKLNSTASLVDRFDRRLNVNSTNIDEMIENMRRISENLKEFTETIKTQPYILVRSSEPKARQPGEAAPP